MPPRWTQTRRALRRSAGSSLGSWQVELCLGKEKAGVFKDFRKIFKFCQLEFHLLSKIIWQNNWSTKNCLSQ
jgi:hypothetical protein